MRPIRGYVWECDVSACCLLVAYKRSGPPRSSQPSRPPRSSPPGGSPHRSDPPRSSHCIHAVSLQHLPIDFVPLKGPNRSHNATYYDLLNRSHATYSEICLEMRCVWLLLACFYLFSKNKYWGLCFGQMKHVSETRFWGTTMKTMFGHNIEQNTFDIF